MKAIFTYLLLTLPYFLVAQQLEKEVLTTSGGHIIDTEANLNIHWSVGEVTGSTLTADEIQLTQGFHQLDLLIDPIYSWPNSDIQISIYPNPTSDAILLSQTGSESFNIRMVDLYGKTIFQGRWRADEFQIDMSHLPDQTYALTVASKQRMQSFKIVKQAK